jgi:preprotein translocase SecE subunit
MSLQSFASGVRAEFKHISWPTPKEAGLLAVLVIVISLLVGAYLGVLDTFFARLLGTVLF